MIILRIIKVRHNFVNRK